MAGIATFTATPLASGSAIRFDWTLDASLNASNTTDIRLYLDMSLVDNVIREVEVIPLVDASGVLTTSYIVDELTNGQEYRVLLEVTTMVQGVLTVFSRHLSAIPSTKPNSVFIMVGQNLDSGFYLKLFSDAALATPLVRNSVDDGFSPLTGAFVIISNSLTGTSVYLDNSGNRLYNTHITPIQLDASFGQHEVSVRIVNMNGSSKTSATANLVISSSITAVNVVRVAEQIAIDPSANATYNVARMVLAWNAPDYIGSPALNGYTIRRAVFDASGVLGSFSVVSTQAAAIFVNALPYIHDASYSYIDANVVAGETYVYDIVGYNANGSGEAAVYGGDLLNSYSFRAVAWPTINTVTSVPGNLSSTISSTITGGFDPSANIEFAVDVAGKGITRSTNPVLITGLNNLQTYGYIVTGFAPSPNVNKVYATPQHTLLYTTPIEAPPSIVAFSGSAVDASANPLNGAVQLSWELSSNLFNFVSNEYSISTRIFRKLASAPDASYTLVTDVSSNSLLNSFVDNSLTNGTVYNYVVRTVYTNSEVAGELLGAMSAPITVKPFNTPAKPSSISITSNNSMVDLSYNYTDPANTSGSAIVGHRFVLLNMNNGRASTALTGLDLSVDVLDGFNTVSKAGTLANIFGNLNPGTKYSLSLDSFVVENGVKHYSTRNGVALTPDSTTFTVPSGLTNVTVSNVDGSGVALSSSNINGILRLSWSYPEGQDASGMTFRIVNGVTGATIQNAINSLTADVTGLSVGVASSSGFKVLPILNNVSAPLNTAQAVTGTPIFIPAAVSSLTILGRNSTSIDFSFNSVTYHGGMDASNTKYLVELIRKQALPLVDMLVDQLEVNHAAGSLSCNFSNMSTDSRYIIRITTKALNPMVEDGYISSAPFIMDNVVVYDAAQNIALFEAKPSDAAIVSKWQPILSLPAGLSFSEYELAIKLATAPDTSYNAITYGPQQSSVYTFSTLLENPTPTSLVNSTEYSVRMRTNYLDANNVYVRSSWSDALLVTPQTAPQPPTNLTYALNSTGTGITLSWDYNATPTHYSIVVESDGTFNYHFEADNVSISSLTFDNLTNKYMYAGITGLVPGRNYLARVYAEFQTMVSSIVYYSSSAPATRNVITYETPSVPRNLRAIMMDQAFQPIWDLPSNTGGQGDTLNYDIYLSTGAPDASGVFAPVTGATLQELSGNAISGGSGIFRVSHAQMVAGIKFISLTNFQRYSFTVKSIILNSGTVVAASGLASLDRLYPRAPPSVPTIGHSIIQTPTQSNIQMVMNSDPSFNINKYQLFRRIIDTSSNLVISPYTLIAEKTFPALGFNTIAQGAEREWTVVDDNTVSSPFWLDGNKFQYKFVVYHNDDNINSASGTNGDDVLEVETSQIIKIFKPFVCGANGLPVSPGVMVADMSLNTLSFLVNKAGSPISSVNTVLLANEVVQVRSHSVATPDINTVVTELANDLVQKSVGNNGGTAANQVVRVTLTNLDFTTLDDALSVVGNAVGTTIAVWPSDGAFSNLSN